MKRLLMFVCFSLAMNVIAKAETICLRSVTTSGGCKGNDNVRTGQPVLYVQQDGNVVNVPHDGDIVYCYLVSNGIIVYEFALTSTNQQVVFPLEMQGKYELRINVDDKFYIGEITL